MDIGLDGGWIYVMMTSSNYNRFKLGRTKGNPLQRHKGIRTGDPGLALQAAYFIPASHGLKLSKVENALHREFEARIPFLDGALSEWFIGNPKIACEWIEYVLGEWKDQPVTSDLNMLGDGRICRAFESDLRDLYAPPTSPDSSDGIPY